MPHIGRFAPSPTGPLHFGSLLAAVASYCDAKANQGAWLVRMEDLDQPREIQGAAETILTTLNLFGFVWDGDVMRQSKRSEAYQAAFDQLLKKGLIYPCTCSRKEIADSSSIRGIEGAIYPKTCLQHPIKNNIKPAYRIKSEDKSIAFLDRIQGEIHQNIANDIGDFVLKRADGFFAYQLAVLIDDAEQGITHVVRGADLLDSTPRQIYLQEKLSLTQPIYAHIPIICNANKEKLSKQTLARAIHHENASELIIKALHFLGQNPEDNLMNAPPNIILEWGIAHWNLNKIPKERTILLVEN